MAAVTNLITRVMQFIKYMELMDSIHSHPRALGSNPGSVKIFFSFLLSLRTIVRSIPSGVEKWISKMQVVAVKSRAKYYKKY